MFRPALAALPLSQHEVDRDHLARARPALFDELWAEDATRILPVWRGRALVHNRGEAEGLVALDLLPVTSVPVAAAVRVYLGRTLAATRAEPAGTPVVAVVLTDAAAAVLEPDENRWANLRTAAATFDDRDAGLFTEALAIANWHASHPHCPRCGTPTVIEQGGWVRRCFVDDIEIFPRTDAAVIVAVLDADERILLGSNSLWEQDRYSLLAGFVEPGESFEAAVLREVGEEAGIRVTDPRYLASQPWPFPASIMVGFRATLARDQDPAALVPDGDEIVSLRWFSRNELRAGMHDVVLPGPSSIARAIIEDWLGELL